MSNKHSQQRQKRQEIDHRTQGQVAGLASLVMPRSRPNRSCRENVGDVRPGHFGSTHYARVQLTIFNVTSFHLPLHCGDYNSFSFEKNILLASYSFLFQPVPNGLHTQTYNAHWRPRRDNHMMLTWSWEFVRYPEFPNALISDVYPSLKDQLSEAGQSTKAEDQSWKGWTTFIQLHLAPRWGEAGMWVEMLYDLNVTIKNANKVTLDQVHGIQGEFIKIT